MEFEVGIAFEAVGVVDFVADEEFGPEFTQGEGCREEEQFAVASLHDLAVDSEGGYRESDLAVHVVQNAQMAEVQSRTCSPRRRCVAFRVALAWTP